ncbi:ABC transporter ATP-binding protein [Arthrobacter rhombi]|uniref:ABC transporter ATP-binding protein n=1 Tax=Arthrobacter rhombi TaxID=71253 RepID=UPI0031D8BA9E
MTAPTAPLTPPREPDILCQELVRIYAHASVEVQALQGLSLRLERGELTALVGASGSGKSTLLSILAGQDRPTAGSARLAGHDLTTMGRRERLAFRRKTTGFVWQQTSRNLLPYLTAAQNVAFPATVAGGDASHRRALELLDLLDVAHCADRRPTELSGGEQQRVAIAVAITNAPQVVLADEPTGELDEETSSDVLEALRQVNRELGITTLIVTHDPAVAEHVQRTVEIRDGRCSTEVLRSTSVSAAGVTTRTAEEFAVLDHAGRMQLPSDYVSALGLRDRVRLALHPDQVTVRPGDATTTPPPPPPRHGRHAGTGQETP